MRFPSSLRIPFQQSPPFATTCASDVAKQLVRGHATFALSRIRELRACLCSEIVSSAQPLVRLRVRRPVASGIAKWVYRQIFQEVCPWNVSFAQELRIDEFRARKLFVERNSGEETRALAREVSMMQPADYAAAFKGSAIKRAKL